MSTSEQARADAFADAETLRMMTLDLSKGETGYKRSRIGKAGLIGATAVATLDPSNGFRPGCEAQWASMAASAAFRAVPGLRGDR